MNTQPTNNRPLVERNKAVRILAKSIFRELTAQGYSDTQIVNLAGELIGEVTSSMATRTDAQG